MVEEVAVGYNPKEAFAILKRAFVWLDSNSSAEEHNAMAVLSSVGTRLKKIQRNGQMSE